MLWKQKEQSPLFTPKTRTGNEGKIGFLKGRSRAQNPFLDMPSDLSRNKTEIREFIIVQ